MKPSIPLNITVTIPVFNQLHYTTQCVDSLNHAGVTDEQIVIVNNASTDGTAEFLALRPRIQAVNNETNTGCGPAWTQGSKLSHTEWTVVLNNDVLVPSNCFQNLQTFAEENNYDVVSPAMCEGECDYDWQSYAADFMEKMQFVERKNIAHGVCFMVHRRVFEKIGYFNNFGGYEDDDFFRRVLRAGFKMAMTGSAFLHHFGMATQKSIKSEQVMAKVYERRERYRRETGLTWPKRKWSQLRNSVRGRWWRISEKRRFGHTLKERRQDGRWDFF